MNIATQLCGLSIIGVLVFFYFTQRKVDFKNSRIFAAALFLDMACLLLDIISIWAIKKAGDVIDPRQTSFICKLYLISLVSVAYIGFVYAVSIVPVTEKGGNRIVFSALAVCITGVAFITVLPVKYKDTGMTTFSYGPACTVAYIFAPYFMIMTFLIVLFYRKRLSINVMGTVTFWILFEFVCAIVQFLFPKLLLVGFASAMGLAVIYFELENPALQSDKNSGLFNLTTLQQYINDFYLKDLPFSYIIIQVTYDAASPQDTNELAAKQTAAALRSINCAKAFYIGQLEFMLVFRDPRTAEEEAKDINGIMQQISRVYGSSFIEILDKKGRRAGSLTEIREITGSDSVIGHPDNNIFEITDEIYERFRQEKLVIKEIDEALAEDRVEAFFQPIYSISEDSFTGAEALTRIRKKDGSLLSPGLFIPISEKTGQITKIGDRMFEKTLDIIKNSGIRNLGVKFIDVNLSALQCEDPMLSIRYLDAMKKAGVPPEMFCFEITETAMIGSRNKALNNLENFRKAGCSCSLDDFGTGESNLNYVIDLPINFIKADRSMVIKYTSSDKVNLVMNLMIHMAKGLSLKTVAEGVETDDDLDAMKSLRIDYIQGFYFSRPLPRDEYIRFLKENRL